MFAKTQHHGSAGNRTMSYVSKIMRRRVILFSTVAAIALVSGGVALRNFSNAIAQPKMAVENPAAPLGLLTVAAGIVRGRYWFFLPQDKGTEQHVTLRLTR